MRSIRTKTTALTILAIVAGMTIATAIGVAAIRNIGSSSSDQMLKLLCRTGERNLDSYFESIEQSVEAVSAFVDSDLQDTAVLSDEALAEHIERSRALFMDVAEKTNGCLTYYYRIDPEVSKDVKGFWYVNIDDEGFKEHEVTDITLYDTEDTSALVWFTVPKASGKAIWLPPYITDNLDVRVLSYNVPVYWRERFIGVVGIEIDYSTMAGQVDNIRLYDNGYAFINDAEGNIIYHPGIDVLSMAEEDRPKAPPGLLSDDNSVRYKYEGVEKQAVWLPLSNGMRLNVTVPVSEINAGWRRMIIAMVLASVVLLTVFVLLALRLTGSITRPLGELTDAAKEVDKGNYDVEISYDGDDEIGILARAFNQLISHLKVYINDLNNLAYADALTSVHNKGAFDIYIRKLQARMNSEEGELRFAAGIFDCDDLKQINDEYGHDKGDIYLKTACSLICSVFMHSPVFRIGGDEFAVIIINKDYEDREKLIKSFNELSAESCRTHPDRWDQVRVAYGISDYDPDTDVSIDDIFRRADKLMYENKHDRKVGR